MSDTSKSSKKKYSQQELRRIMSETKAAKQVHQLDAGLKRIDSPLAKYNDLGQLICVLCRSVVRSEAVWKVHIHSKQHKQSVEEAKQLKQPPIPNDSASDVTLIPSKRSAAAESIVDHIPMKKPKGILKNSQSGTVQNAPLPDDFFDHNRNSGKQLSSSIRKELVNIRLPEKHHGHNAESMEQDVNLKEVPPIGDEEQLPEGFFDDPKMDAKARNQEYKDPNDEEWEKFQKEIKEATNVSMAIISEEQEESTAERQIAEIDEQIRNWSRVLYFEKKKEKVQTLKGTSSQTHPTKLNFSGTKIKLETENDGDDDNDDDDVFEEFLDWRAKKSYK